MSGLVCANAAVAGGWWLVAGELGIGDVRAAGALFFVALPVFATGFTPDADGAETEAGEEDSAEVGAEAGAGVGAEDGTAAGVGLVAAAVEGGDCAGVDAGLMAALATGAEWTSAGAEADMGCAVLLAVGGVAAGAAPPC